MLKQNDGTIMSLHTHTDAHSCTRRVKEFAPTEDEKWVQEFENQVSSQGKTLASVAKEMTEAVTDPEINATEVSCSSSCTLPLLPTLPSLPHLLSFLSSFPLPSPLSSSFLLPIPPSQFMDFVGKLSTGEARFDDQQEVIFAGATK